LIQMFFLCRKVIHELKINAVAMRSTAISIIASFISFYSWRQST
jgi:hypothetical protein